MDHDSLKALVGRAALKYVPAGAIIGVGTGSTVDHFIAALATIEPRIPGAVASSVRSADALRRHGIPVLDANTVERLPVYIDGADEIDRQGRMIKGGGGALTREKIVADLADCFVCIVDRTKQVDVLGAFPLPVEVIPMAAARLTRRFAALGGAARPRHGVVTDNGNVLLDVHGLSITDPLALESEVNQWPGVVTVGLFARRPATLCLVAAPDGVTVLRFAADPAADPRHH